MEHVVSVDDNKQLEELADAARNGEEIVLTQNGERIAVLQAKQTPTGNQGAAAAFERILQRGRGVRLNGLDLKSLAHEGHGR